MRCSMQWSMGVWAYGKSPRHSVLFKMIDKTHYCFRTGSVAHSLSGTFRDLSLRAFYFTSSHRVRTHGSPGPRGTSRDVRPTYLP